MAKKGEITYQDDRIGPVRLCKSGRARRISIRVHPVKGVSVTVPRWIPYAAALLFFKTKRDWVRATMERQKKRLAAIPEGSAKLPSKEETEALRARARTELPARLAVLAEQHGFQYNRVIIKNNSSNWGSCSVRGNINLNLRLVTLPDRLRDYVMLHELCHLRYMNHGPEFHALLEEVCPGHRALQRELHLVYCLINS